MTNIATKVAHSKKVIREALNKYDRIAVASSFGKDSMVLLHLCRQIDPNIQVFTVMTPFKFKETYEFKDRIINEWNLNIKEYGYKKSITSKDLYKTDPNLCCQIYKVEPLANALEEMKLDAWMAALRASENPNRKGFKEVEKRGNIIKINPILAWTELDVWRYSALYNVPQHPLYRLGYRSLGCEPCSAITDENEPERAGRWKATSKQGGECGIHTKRLL